MKLDDLLREAKTTPSRSANSSCVVADELHGHCTADEHKASKDFGCDDYQTTADADRHASVPLRSVGLLRGPVAFLEPQHFLSTRHLKSILGNGQSSKPSWFTSHEARTFNFFERLLCAIWPSRATRSALCVLDAFLPVETAVLSSASCMRLLHPSGSAQRRPDGELSPASACISILHRLLWTDPPHFSGQETRGLTEPQQSTEDRTQIVLEMECIDECTVVEHRVRIYIFIYIFICIYTYTSQVYVRTKVGKARTETKRGRRTAQKSERAWRMMQMTSWGRAVVLGGITRVMGSTAYVPTFR